MNITLKEIVAAYRKAKVDAWLRHDMDEDSFFQFEYQFERNIRSFHRFINQPAQQIVFTPKWLGGWRFALKKIVPKNVEEDRDLSITSNPAENFRFRDIESANYRLMAQPTVNFQLLSALWINIVAWKYDAKLGKDIYGNRLRPLKNGKQNLSARGSFQYYLPKFKEWKGEGIKALNSILKSKGAVVVTADAKAFFHCLKPDCLLNDDFLRRNVIHLTARERELTRKLIDAINVWAEKSPLGTGLPVGLIASCVIANVALLDFDKRFRNMPDKIFYGRYVDDLLLIMEHDPKLKTRSDVWRKVANAVDGLVPNVVAEQDKETFNGVIFSPDYVADITKSKVVFAGGKCRAFFLDKKTGPSFVATLESQIRDITSEFRYLPKSIFESKGIEDKILRLVSDDGDLADNFRKIDALTFRRGELKHLVSDMDFLLFNLPPDSWRKQRIAFYNIVVKHLVTYQKFFEYAETDFPRIISLATQCGDFEELGKMLSSMMQLSNNIVNIRKAELAGGEVSLNRNDVERRWRDALFAAYARCIRCSFNASSGKEYANKYGDFVQSTKLLFAKNALPRALVAEIRVSVYAFHDLAATSLMRCLYKNGIRPYTATCNVESGLRTGCVKLSKSLCELFDRDYLQCAFLLAQFAIMPYGKLEGELPYGILLPTRPLEENDLSCVGDGCYLQAAPRVFATLRGYDLRVPEEMVIDNPLRSSVTVLSVENNHIKKPIVALLNLKTEEEMCCGEIRPIDLDKQFKRFRTIAKGINSIIEKGKNIDYIVIHELALPLRWFVSLGKHCANHEISLISGIAYRVTDKKKCLCKNEVWLSLVCGKDRFKRPVLIKEEKQAFAREEAFQLSSQFSYTQDTRLPVQRHSVIVHGAFAFSTLICSELMDIFNRSRLQGLIDALFVLAWNKDLGSFGSVIESSALDLHAFIVQSNNNEYGDSRIRSPEKDSWRRDVLRIRGGLGVYSIIDQLDVPALREFQQHRDAKVYFAEQSKDDPLEYKNKRRFKPMPLGYEKLIPDYRRT